MSEPETDAPTVIGAGLPHPVTTRPDERRLYSEARRMAAGIFAPMVEAGDEGRLNRPLLEALGESGLLPRLFPTSHGGLQQGEVSAVTLCLLREAVAIESPETETALALQGLGGYPILQSGREEVAARWVPEIASGHVVPAFALTEPGAGSDAAALEMVAEPDGSGWRLTGTKTWISNAPDADVYTVFARTSSDPGSRGVTAFVVPNTGDGITGEPIELVAPHPIGTVVFDGVPVPATDVLGAVGTGFQVAMRTLDRFRPSVGAFAVGMAQAALESAVAHADSREAFGGTLRDLQAVGHMLADMAVATHTARLVVLEAATAFDEGVEPLTLRSSMAKLYATESAQRVVDLAIQIHGARALERGHLLERLYRDVRAPRIYEGASEVQKSIIAKRL